MSIAETDPKKKRILFLTPQVPSPTRQGAAIRNWNLMTQLAKTYDLDLLTFSDPREGEEYRRAPHADSVPWQQIARIAPPHRSLARRLRVLLTSRRPDMADRLWSPALLQQLAKLLSSERYDIIQAEGIELARYVQLISRHRLPDYNPLLVFDEHNAEWVLQRRAAATDLRRPRRLLAGIYSTIQQGRLRRFEAATMQIADLTLCVSAVDAAALQPLAPRCPLVIAPNGVDLGYYSTAGLPRERPRFDLIFSGTLDYRPNIDAAHWLVEEIWPRLQQIQGRQHERPLRLALMGRNPPQEITRMVRHTGVTVTGSVADDRPYFAGATVYALPMRYGGGSRLKLLNALAMGCAVVSTSAGAEGVEVRHNEHLLIADDPDDFAASISQLLNDPGLRQRLGTAGQQFMQEQYDWAGIVARIVAAYEATLAHRTANPPVSEPPQ